MVDHELGPQLHYAGVDDRGVKLHVIAVPDDLTVIHAMPASFTRSNDQNEEDT